MLQIIITLKTVQKLLPIFFLIPAFSIAQNNFQPGTVVKLNGDTLHGFINYGTWENNPKKISFRKDSASATVKLTPKEIKYFNVSVGYLSEYQRYAGTISTNNTEINHLLNVRDTSAIIDTVFLKIVQSGKNMILYSFADNLKTRFFIARKPGTQPEELIYRIYYNGDVENGYNRTSYENTYQKQLYQVATELNLMTGDLKNDIEKSSCNEGDLIKIAGKINGITDQETLKHGLSHPKPYLFILVTVTFLVLYFTVHLKSTF